MYTNINIMNSFILSYFFSLIVQIISFFIQLYGYLLPINPKIKPLKYSLNVEFLVSIIELFVYFWIGYSLHNLKSVMNKRYLDWFITTNFMILSLSLLFIFYSQKERREKHNDTYDKKLEDNSNIISNNIFTILPIMFFNTLMLIMGYLGEIQYIQKLYSFSIGFIFFFLSFYLLYVQFANKSINGKRVFYIIAFIWSLYGIAHLFKKIPKNTSYNILDLISKNALGIFLVYELIGETSV